MSQQSEQTLLLRVLGRADRQKRALEEFLKVPTPPPLYRSIEETLTAYRAILESRGKVTPEEEELLMNLSTIYQNLCQDWLEEGRQSMRLEFAIGLLQRNMDFDLILELTGLTVQEVQTLRDRLSAGESPTSIING